MEQRSEEWFEARRGKVTNSRLGDVIGSEAAQRRYAEQLLAELRGEPIRTFDAPALRHGRECEPKAIELYARYGAKVKPAEFYVDKRLPYYGGSPDGLVDDGVLEVKCPYNHMNHIQTLAYGMPPKHKAQVFGHMAVTGVSWVDFVSYYPGLPLYTQRIFRDDGFIEQLYHAIEDFWESFVLPRLP